MDGGGGHLEQQRERHRLQLRLLQQQRRAAQQHVVVAWRLWQRVGERLDEHREGARQRLRGEVREQLLRRACVLFLHSRGRVLVKIVLALRRHFAWIAVARRAKLNLLFLRCIQRTITALALAFTCNK
eukprot:scaffold59978_cov61-Phaeocystis_antarctica.AAC.2